MPQGLILKIERRCNRVIIALNALKQVATLHEEFLKGLGEIINKQCSIENFVYFRRSCSIRQLN